MTFKNSWRVILRRLLQTRNRLVQNSSTSGSTNKVESYFEGGCVRT
jgi:hypothetical protein